MLKQGLGLTLCDGLRCAYNLHIKNLSTLFTVAHNGVNNCTTGAIVI